MIRFVEPLKVTGLAVTPVGPTRDLIDPQTVYAFSVIRAPQVSPSDTASPFALGAVSDHAVSGLDMIAPAGATPVEILSFVATEDFTTAGSDTPPNTHFDGRILHAGSISRSVGLSPLAAAERTVATGSISLANGDGNYDAVGDDYDLAGTTVKVDVGRRGAAFTAFQRVATARILRADITLDDLQFVFDDFVSLYDASFPQSVYAGSGGTEGGADLRDMRKPLVIGHPYNVTPVLVDPATILMQVHQGSLFDIAAVRFGGSPFTKGADHPTVAALQAATVTTGTYQTCLAAGFFRPGLVSGWQSSTGFVVTCDPKATSGAEAAVLAQSLALQASTAIPAPYDAASWAAVVAARTGYNYGRYITTEVTWRDVMNDLCRSMAVYWGTNRKGEISAGWLYSPVLPPPLVDFLATGVANPAGNWYDEVMFPSPSGTTTDAGPGVLDVSTVSLTLDESDILSIARLGLPDGFGLAYASMTIRYKHNWTPGATLAAVANKADLRAEWSERTVISPTPSLSKYVPDTEDTGLIDQTGASNLCNTMLALHGRPRAMYSVTIPMALGSPGELAQVFVTYPRFGLLTGRLFVTVAVIEDYEEGTVSLTLWG